MVEPVLDMRKICIQPLQESLFTATSRNQPVHIVRHVERHLPREWFIYDSFPTIATENIVIFLVHPVATTIFRPQESFESKTIDVVVPQVFPVIRPFEILFVNILFTQFLCYGSDCIIAIGIFECASSRSLGHRGNISFGIILLDTATTFISRVLRFYLGIFNHCGQSFFVINTRQIFHDSVSNQYIAVRAPLYTTVTIPATAVRHISLVLINIYHRPYDIGLTRRFQKSEQRVCSSECIPDGIIIVEIRFGRFPQRILTRAVGRL